MEQRIIEGTTPFLTDSERKISREMAVFYNPVMKLNRDTTLAMLLAMERGPRTLRIGLPMEASGVRAARILHELVAPGLFAPRSVAINDISPEAVAHARENIALNSEGMSEGSMGKGAPVEFSTLDASIFLRSSRGFDYIDIDPFGTPNPFLDAAAQRIERDGILALTATDTAALAGTYPRATARKYWSVPSRTWLMHDAGLRILIRKAQLVGAQYDKAFTPVLSISADHYYRVFLRCERSHTKIKDVLRDHRFLHVCASCMQTSVSSENADACACAGCGGPVSVAGPLWTGPLHEIRTVRRMREGIKRLDATVMEDLDALLAIIEDECRLGAVGFYDIHELASRAKTAAPRRDALLSALGEHGCRTHISGHGVKTDLPVKEVAQLISGMARAANKDEKKKD